ncbi:NADP oxidoreductase, coenzyme F420-dependent [Candidatus Terasakiella magnetica]|uniref:Pyrroline-5-carboxylate reductase n=1 Tax=Candidatus Terasakiella magnetica TaxID=1867952 RepID=A0A1C3RIN9_9PROT|nr:pyrroline-5-carboxylate reductase [Candidatus Terasakiella magnetica]SCA57133.1 NADP oxidoreductase, coenzyme F420-dependent [Candidatus Terasakiella magnetica]
MGLVLIGCGKMGGAMLEGWLDQGVPKDTIRIVEHSAEHAQALRDTHDVRVIDDIKDIEDGFPADIVVLAVKPQGMDDAAQSCQRFGNNTTFLSIAAGKTVSYFEGHLGENAAIIRVMPNTPAAVRRGISVAYANDKVSDEAKTICTDLLGAIGEVAWVEDEALMDPVTAVSGSGPAYVFYMTECLAQAGIKAGLSEELATQLARATIAGAGELMRQSGTDASQLRINVTSPGGTTQAALEVLMSEDGIAPAMDKAVDAATQRSKELAG